MTTLVAARMAGPRPTLLPWTVAGALALISLVGFMNRLPFERALYPNQPLFAQQDEIRAFLFLYRQADLAGVLLKDVEWWHTGGYSYLRRDVPLYLPEHESAMWRNGRPGPRAYASHIVCRVSTAEIEGFTSVAQFGQLEVRKQVAPPASYSILPSYNRVVPQPGIDGVYPEPALPCLPWVACV